MTLLTLVAGGERYGIDIGEIQAVIPRPALRPLAMVPAWIAGVLSFFEYLVPVVDLCLLHGGQPARPRLGTRVVVARYPLADGSVRMLGLMAERALGIVDTAARVMPSVVAQGDAAWLDGIVADEAAGLVQLLKPTDLLTDEVRAVLFPS